MCVQMTYTTLFKQNKLIFQKLDEIMNPELALEFLKVLIVIGSLMFHFKVVMQVVFKKVKIS